MEFWFITTVLVLLVIVAAALIGPKLGLASPLLLVAAGVAASFLPALDGFVLNPDLVLSVMLPPLLYSSAVAIPSMNFRREFTAISSLSVLLVVASSFLLGWFFSLVIPGLSLAWGVALGAIISPTDAVATSIVKRSGASKRAVVILDGESLLNDASSLVILRTAITASAATISFWGSVGAFFYSVVIACLVGGVVGYGSLFIRERITDSTAQTILSFTVPCVAVIPTEAFGASGLVAAVVAGLITGSQGPVRLSSKNRFSDQQNWRTLETILEGIIFLMMGLQLHSILLDVERDDEGALVAVLLALVALVIILLVRALYLTPLFRLLERRRKKYLAAGIWLRRFKEEIETEKGRELAVARLKRRKYKDIDRGLERMVKRATRIQADADYLLRERLGWREGLTVVWAGMRGAVTVAAAQSLPINTPMRSTLILIAFAVAAFSLLLQGSTIGAVVRRITLPETEEEHSYRAREQERLRVLMREAALSVVELPPLDSAASKGEKFDRKGDHRLAVLQAQREALLKARQDGTFDADLLYNTLLTLDADEIAIELRGRIRPIT